MQAVLDSMPLSTGKTLNQTIQTFPDVRRISDHILTTISGLPKDFNETPRFRLCHHVYQFHRADSFDKVEQIFRVELALHVTAVPLDGS